MKTNLRRWITSFWQAIDTIFFCWNLWFEISAFYWQMNTFMAKKFTMINPYSTVSSWPAANIKINADANEPWWKEIKILLIKKSSVSSLKTCLFGVLYVCNSADKDQVQFSPQILIYCNDQSFPFRYSRLLITSLAATTSPPRDVSRSPRSWLARSATFWECEHFSRLPLGTN